MAKRTPSEVYTLLTQAGFSGAQAVTMTAIAGAESGWDDASVGDVSLQNATWGPSFGLFQIRTLKAETGRGTVRDINALTGDPAAQARAAYAISQQGRDFTPWTVFTSGKYQQFLGQAQDAAGGAGAGGVLSTINTGLTSSIASGARDLVITGLVVIGGLGLAVLGTARVFGPKIKATTDRVRRDVAGAAKAVL